MIFINLVSLLSFYTLVVKARYFNNTTENNFNITKSNVYKVGDIENNFNVTKSNVYNVSDIESDYKYRNHTIKLHGVKAKVGKFIAKKIGEIYITALEKASSHFTGEGHSCKNSGAECTIDDVDFGWDVGHFFKLIHDKNNKRYLCRIEDLTSGRNDAKLWKVGYPFDKFDFNVDINGWLVCGYMDNGKAKINNRVQRVNINGYIKRIRTDQFTDALMQLEKEKINPKNRGEIRRNVDYVYETTYITKTKHNRINIKLAFNFFDSSSIWTFNTPYSSHTEYDALAKYSPSKMSYRGETVDPNNGSSGSGNHSSGSETGKERCNRKLPEVIWVIETSKWETPLGSGNIEKFCNRSNCQKAYYDSKYSDSERKSYWKSCQHDIRKEALETSIN